MNYKLLYIIIINILSFIIMGWDKYSAIKGNWRISENNLFGLSLIGGSYGIQLGMIVFRHKTNKIKFRLFIPLFIIINTIIYYLILK